MDLSALLQILGMVVIYGSAGYLCSRIQYARCSKSCAGIAIKCLIATLVLSFFRHPMALVFLFAAISQVYMSIRFHQQERFRRLLEDAKNPNLFLA